jgi:CBS domain-containing protein
MHSLVKDLMTTPVVTVGPATPFKEIVARLAEHRVSALPVVDDAGRVIAEGGRLVGIVSRADLLKVFNRPDGNIHREILDEVIVGEFMMDPSRFFIHVDDGVVVLQGRVEQRSLLPWVVRAVRGVEGVVRVEDRLAYDIDDIDVGRLMTYPWVGR